MLRYEQLCQICGVAEDGSALSPTLEGHIKAIPKLMDGPLAQEGSQLQLAAAMIAFVQAQFTHSFFQDKPFNPPSAKQNELGWVPRSDLVLALKQVAGLTWPNWSILSVSNRVETQVTNACDTGILRSCEFDTWSPGQASGSGWEVAVGATQFGISRARAIVGLPEPGADFQRATQRARRSRAVAPFPFPFGTDEEYFIVVADERFQFGDTSPIVAGHGAIIDRIKGTYLAQSLIALYETDTPNRKFDLVLIRPAELDAVQLVMAEREINRAIGVGANLDCEEFQTQDPVFFALGECAKRLEWLLGELKHVIPAGSEFRRRSSNRRPKSLNSSPSGTEQGPAKERLTVMPDGLGLSCDGIDLRVGDVPEIPFAILLRVARRPNQPIGFDTLREKGSVWDGYGADDSTIRGAVSRLKQCLEGQGLRVLASAIRTQRFRGKSYVVLNWPPAEPAQTELQRKSH